MQTTMINAPKKDYSPFPAGKCAISTMQSIEWRHQVIEGNGGFEAERVRALGALRSLQSKKKLAAEKHQETHFRWNEENEKSIEDYVERETAGARIRVEDTEAAIKKEQEDTEAAENTELTTREPEKTLNEMMLAIWHSLSDIASSDDWEDGEDDDDQDTDQGQLIEDGQPGWVMGTITKTVQQCMERFRQKQKKLDKVTQPGWEDATDYYRGRDMKYSTSDLRVPAVVQPQTDDDTAAPALPPLGELMECLDIVRGILQMPQGTTQPGRSHMRLGTGKLWSNTRIPGLAPTAEPNSSLSLIAMPVERVSSYPCI